MWGSKQKTKCFHLTRSLKKLKLRSFLPIFKAARKYNYAIEAVTYLPEATILLPPQLQEQLIRSRFVNTSGEGGNIAADLHMEHLNRTVNLKER